MPNKVSEIMTKDPIFHTVPSSPNEVVKKLIQNSITGMPMADNKGKYVGMISRRDIFNNPSETQTAMVMRKASAVLDSDSIESAALEMLHQRRRHIAVVNADNRIVGILTPQNFLPIIREKFGDTKVKNVMMSLCVPIWDETPINVVLYSMSLSGVYSSPVIDSNEKFVGLITDRDIFDKVDLKPQTMLAESGIADDEDPWSWGGIRNVMTYMIEKNYIKLPKTPVKDIMVKEPAVVYKNDKLRELVKTMEVKNFNQLPVLESEGKLIGMLYDIELMSVFA
ncbi:hypothetical protein IX51_05385 [uncultured archaeon]|nr:hypothetical protein IX51_05385 [uncultured archaeon]